MNKDKQSIMCCSTRALLRCYLHSTERDTVVRSHCLTVALLLGLTEKTSLLELEAVEPIWQTTQSHCVGSSAWCFQSKDK